jgi:hypothetical protein
MVLNSCVVVQAAIYNDVEVEVENIKWKSACIRLEKDKPHKT